jgi:hypothetical protein
MFMSVTQDLDDNKSETRLHYVRIFISFGNL